MLHTAFQRFVGLLTCKVGSKINNVYHHCDKPITMIRQKQGSTLGHRTNVTQRKYNWETVPSMRVSVSPGPISRQTSPIKWFRVLLFVCVSVFNPAYMRFYQTINKLRDKWQYSWDNGKHMNLSVRCRSFCFILVNWHTLFEVTILPRRQFWLNHQLPIRTFPSRCSNAHCWIR